MASSSTVCRVPKASGSRCYRDRCRSAGLVVCVLISCTHLAVGDEAGAASDRALHVRPGGGFHHLPPASWTREATEEYAASEHSGAPPDRAEYERRPLPKSEAASVMRREHLRHREDDEDEAGANSDIHYDENVMPADPEDRRPGRARHVEDYPREDAKLHRQVQLTLSLPTEDLGTLLLDVARAGKRHRHDQDGMMEAGDGSEDDSGIVAASTLSIGHAAAPSPSQRDAGTTPSPSKKQELPAPSPMPIADTSDDAMKGMELFFGMMVFCSCCCGGSYWIIKKYCMGGAAAAPGGAPGQAGPGGPLLGPGMQQQAGQPPRSEQRSYRQTRKAQKEAAPAPAAGEAGAPAAETGGSGGSGEAPADATNAEAAAPAAEAEVEQHF